MHKDNQAEGQSVLPVSRRRFVQGFAAGGAIAALDWNGWAALYCSTTREKRK